MRASFAYRMGAGSVWAASFALAVVLLVAEDASAQCRSDCDLDNQVEMSDLVTLTETILEITPVTACPLGADENGDGELSVGDVVAAVTVARTGICTECLSQCGDGQVTCDEVCDVGGVCVGGALSGMPCNSEAACGIEEPGRCEGGLLAFHQCLSDDDCGGGACRRCVMHGGQMVPGGTCAADCSLETALPLHWRAGVIEGGQLSSGSGAVIHGVGEAPVPVAFGGSSVLRVGAAAAGGVRPLTIRAEDVVFPPTLVSTLGCACLRGIAARTCGGVLTLLDGTAANDCTPGFSPGDSVCGGGTQPPCTFVHGAGNAASGIVGCDGLAPIDVVATLQLPEQGSSVSFEGDGAPGSALLLHHLAIAVKEGPCDGFCSAADPQSERGLVRPQFFTTGNASGEVFDSGGNSILGPVVVQGQGRTCNELVESPAGLVWVTTSVGNDPEMGAEVATIQLEAE